VLYPIGRQRFAGFWASSAGLVSRRSSISSLLAFVVPSSRASTRSAQTSDRLCNVGDVKLSSSLSRVASGCAGLKESTCTKVDYHRHSKSRHATIDGPDQAMQIRARFIWTFLGWSGVLPTRSWRRDKPSCPHACLSAETYTSAPELAMSERLASLWRLI